MIERLIRLHLDGDTSVYEHLAREWERRGERWCGGVSEPPPILTLEALREWAEAKFSADGLTAVIEESGYDGKPTVFLREEGKCVAHLTLGVCRVSADCRPWFRFFDGPAHRATTANRTNGEDFCSNWHVARTDNGAMQLIKECWPRDGHVWNVDQYPLDLCPITPPHQDQQPTPAEVP